MKYSMFIGRWQPWHDGHQWLIDQRIKEGKNICIAIRDIEPNENQPWTPQEVEENLNKRFAKEIEDGSIKVVIIPDIVPNKPRRVLTLLRDPNISFDFERAKICFDPSSSIIFSNSLIGLSLFVNATMAI